MALSTCGKCGNHLFEVETHEPSGSRYKLNFVQCSTCGTVVGVLDYWNIGAVLKKHAEALKAIAAQAGVYVNLD